jgi:hypothetical protein
MVMIQVFQTKPSDLLLTGSPRSRGEFAMDTEMQASQEPANFEGFGAVLWYTI